KTHHEGQHLDRDQRSRFLHPHRHRGLGAVYSAICGRRRRRAPALTFATWRAFRVFSRDESPRSAELARPARHHSSRYGPCRISTAFRRVPGSGRHLNSKPKSTIPMAKTTTLQELLIEELKDLYSAETQLTKALPKMAKAASDENLKAGFEEHLDQTHEHIARLDRAMELLDASPKGKT